MSSPGMQQWRVTMSKEDSDGIATVFPLNTKSRRDTTSNHLKREKSLESVSTIEDAERLWWPTLKNGDTLLADSEDGLISIMTIRLWTKTSWSQSGGPSSRFSTRASSTVAQRSCLSQLVATLFCQTSKRVQTTKMLKTLPYSSPSLWLMSPMLASWLGPQLHGPYPATWH